MSIQRINHPASHTTGWQARAHVAKGLPRLTRFFADDAHGGEFGAHRLAVLAEMALKRRAKRLQRDRQRG